MTTPNTIVETMNKAHSHGADAEKAHPSRADRPTSFDLNDIAVPHGREEDWRFTPMRRIERLFEPANYDAGDAPVTVDAPAPVVVETVSREDKRLGTVLAPGDRTAVVAWNGFEQATVIEIPAEAELDAPVRINVADVEGTRAVGAIHTDTYVEASRAQHGRVDHVRAVGGADDHDVVEGFDAVHLGEQLRNNHRFDV